MCAVLDVSRSGYYDWLGRPESARSKANRQLLAKIKKIHIESRQAYGAVKTWRSLVDQGIRCGKHRVARIRQENGIEAKRKRRFRASYKANNALLPAPNLLQQHFRTTAPNQVWVSDTTFIPTRAGWLYLAIVLDLYSRRVVGWAMDRKNNHELVCNALRMAISQRKPKRGLIQHSDQGAQYTCARYREIMARHGIQMSLSRKGNCYDNAVAESFFSNLKNELVHGADFILRDQAKSELFDYIEIFYNRQRIHSYLNYKTPVEFERANNVT